MTGRIFIDTFSSLDGIPKKLHGDDDTVLHVLMLAKRFSTFEASESSKLAATIKRLEKAGKIKLEQNSQYPWHNVAIIQSNVQEPGK